MKKFILSFALLLALVIPSYSEWTYDLIWQRNGVGLNTQGLRFSRLNPNDSVVLTMSWDPDTENRNSIFKFNAFTGEVIKYYLNEDSIANFEYSKDGSYLSISSNNFLGFVDTANMQYTLKINYPGINGRYNYNEDKKILTGFTSNTIRLFNSQNGELIKNYEPDYFKPSDLVINNVALSNVDNKLIYDYRYSVFVGPQPDKYKSFNILKIIDNNGKIIYEDNTINLSSGRSPWALSNDRTKIVYFNQNKKMKVLELTTMNTIYEGDVEASSLSFSNDDKLIYMAGQGLKILDLATSKIFIAYSFGSFLGFQLNFHNNDYIYIYNHGVYKFKTNASTGILEIPLLNMFELFINPIQDSIELKFNLENSTLIQSNLINLNGILIKQLENKTFESGTYNLNYELNNLPNGVYFIQIIVNGQQYPQVFKFIKL